MSTEQEKYYLIDRYLRGELAGVELEDFTQKLSNEPGFAEEVAFQKEVNELISVNAYHELRKQMTEDIANLDKGKGNSGFSKNISLLLVAGLLSFAGAGGYWLLSDKQVEQTERTPVKEKSGSYQPASQNDIQVAASGVSPVVRESSTLLKSKATKATKPVGGNEVSESVSNSDIVSNVSVDTFTTPAPLPPPQESGIITNEADPVVSEHSAVAADPCANAVIKARWTTSEACQARNDGRIEVEENTIQGGEEPYSIELYSGAQKVSASDFDRLYSGYYTLKVSDKQGCTGKWEINLPEKNCQQAGVSFSPSQGETWVFNGNEKNSYYISIYNQAGQLIVKSSLQSGVYEWSGISNSGAMVETGFYVYVVEYTNGKKENGQITVIR